LASAELELREIVRGRDQTAGGVEPYDGYSVRLARPFASRRYGTATSLKTD
jgi:hypothetical protein